MLPVAAVGGAAGAVGGIADSGFMVSITRGRLWIGLIGVLLGGIVAINVWGLSISASTSSNAVKIDQLERSNSVFGSRIAKRSSTQKIEAGAVANLGLGVPSAEAVRYVKYKGSTTQLAAERLASGELSVLSALPIAPEFVDAANAAVAPVTPAAEGTTPIDPVLPADPAAVDPATIDPAAAATAPAPAPTPATPPPAEPTATAPPSGGISP